MRKRLATILALILASASFALVGCGGAKPNLPNDSGANSSTEVSDDESSNEGDTHEHVWLDYEYDMNQHWIACDGCEEIKEQGAHVDKGEGKCDVCGSLFPTVGVNYELSQDGTYAVVTGYEGSDTMVVIAPLYEGVPVTEIGATAFQNHAWIVSVDIPNSITEIGADAFCGCTALEGVRIPDSVVYIGDNAFGDCGVLTIYCDAKEQPAGWNANWNPSEHMVIWGYTGKRMTTVSPRALMIGESMLNVDDPNRRQIQLNQDLGDVSAPEGFSFLTRFDSLATGANAWGQTGVLQHFNFDQSNLAEYSEIWFAAKVIGGFWVFVGHTPRDVTSPWVYIHIKKESMDILGNYYWTVEASIGGYVFARNENQFGRFVDGDRPKNSIARLLWDEGFGSPDGNSILIYPLGVENGVTIYCTEIVAVKNDY